jgi:hypothetical protein
VRILGPQGAAFRTLGLFIVLLFISLESCGLEDYPYIHPFPQSNITREFNNRAVVRIPSASDYHSPPFDHFVVFYKIYVSDASYQSTTSDTFSSINPVLASDYNAIRPYIESDTLVNANMDSLFDGIGYKYLTLENDNMDNVLSSSVLGNTLVFHFASNMIPTMTIGSDPPYTLYRSNGNGTFNPLPVERYFVNTDELWRNENINSNTNADVVDKSGIGNSDTRFTYAAMFIAAVGVNVNTYSYIYSTPALIHVFQLP